MYGNVFFFIGHNFLLIRQCRVPFIMKLLSYITHNIKSEVTYNQRNTEIYSQISRQLLK